MKAIVDQELCTGCGFCIEACPGLFELRGGVARVKVHAVPAEVETAFREAMEGCPVDAISREHASWQGKGKKTSFRTLEDPESERLLAGPFRAHPRPYDVSPEVSK